ncbi:MAG: tetratricopeptide repeat protein [Treponema sp.]|jgi:Ca-activated chloride channel family protein|nr:tetratricopeptide repeat protein [Treponema sp.]
MSFDTPQYLYLLFFLIPLVLILVAMEKKRRLGVDFITGSSVAADRELLKKKLLLRIRLSDVFFMLFFVLLVFSLAGPRWGIRLIADQRRGLDLILAFDVSRSMEARDCPPLPGQNEDSSRLERAKAIAEGIALRLGDIRIGIAAGKGRGVLMVPLTFDTEAILNFIDSLGASFFTGTGTNLESLLDAAAGGFKDNLSRRLGIVLLSDGETLTGNLDVAVNRARNNDITVSAIALGSEQGATVPAVISQENPSGVLLDGDGAPVISVLKPDALKNAANKTGGVYIDGSRNDAAPLMADFYESISEMTAAGFRREAIPQWPLFVLLALVSFGVSRFMGFRRKRTPLIQAVLLGLICVFSLMISSCSGVQGKLLVMEGNFYHSRQRYNEAITSYLKALDYDDVAPYAEYGLGLCYSAMEENNAALSRYELAEETIINSKEHRELHYRLQLNTGIIYFEEGDYSAAVEYFRNALEIDGSRLDAKRNLELSLLALSYNQSDKSEAASSSGQTTTSSVTVSEASSTLFEYLRLKEQEQWKSEWAGDSGSDSLDY